MLIGIYRAILEKRSTITNILLTPVAVKGAKGTISLAQAKDAVPGPNCMLKSLWE